MTYPDVIAIAVRWICVCFLLFRVSYKVLDIVQDRCRWQAEQLELETTQSHEAYLLADIAEHEKKLLLEADSSTIEAGESVARLVGWVERRSSPPSE